MRRNILIALAVAAVLVVAAGTFVTARTRSVSAELAATIEQSIGVGPASSGMPGISFWPRFAVTLRNVTLPPPKGMASAPLVSIARLRIVPAGGLFGFGGSGIAEIVLEEPSINLVVDANGRANWNYAILQSGAADASIPLRIENGRAAILDERSGTALAFSDIGAVASLAGPDGEVNAKGAFVWNERRAGFTLYLKSPQRLAQDGSPIELTLETPGLAFQFSGRGATAAGFALDGQAAAKSADLGLLASWFGAALPSGMNGARLDLAGVFDASAKGVFFGKAQFMLDDMRGQGDVGFARRDGRLSIAANIGMDRIDLTRYRKIQADTKSTSWPVEAWSTRPIDLSTLRDLDAAVKVTTNGFAYGAFKTGPAQFTVDLRGGALDLKLENASFAGGSLNAAILLDGKSEVPALQFTLNGEGMAADAAFASLLGFGDLSGTLSSSISVNAAGTSLAEMISTSKGQASFRITKGALARIDLSVMLRKVSESILIGCNRSDGQTTSFDALSAAFTITDGIAQTGNLILVSPGMSFTGKGEVDLLRQALDLKIESRIATAATGDAAPGFAAFPVAIQIIGPWAAPRVYPDMPGILENPASAFEALKKLGLGNGN